MNLQNIKTLFFIGIGGISMSGLALVMKDKGCTVKGSDSKESDITESLAKSGVTVFIGHRKENITDDIEWVVYTAAISNDNPELLEAKKKGITIIPRSKLLGIIMEQFNNSIAVAGTHGKTTTTSMISQILINAGFDPTISIGGIIPAINSNTRIGASDYFIAEACEYTNSFLELYPFVSIVLNVDLDHIDYFKNMEEVRRSFKGFISHVKEGGAVIISNSIENYLELTEGKNAITYGLTGNACWRADNIVQNQEFSEFDLIYKDNILGRARLTLPGEHNISNTLAACAAAHYLGVSGDAIINSIKEFAGTKRRFEFKGIKNGCKYYDDYAHHPCEIKATLKAAKGRKGSGKLWCVFQPHTYTRTKAFLEDFSRSFDDADTIVLSDIYAAREKDTGVISSKSLLEKLKTFNKEAYYFGSFDDIEQFLVDNCKEGDMVLTMGAGNIHVVGEDILSQQ